MKSTQLRIGNWYNEFGIPKQATPEIISNLYAIEQNGKTAIDFDFLPLTEEWLLKAGTKRFGKDFTLHGVIIHSRKRGFVINKSIPIMEYLHQLQNFMFANRGIELEFKL
jgi:hypothetical protein